MTSKEMERGTPRKAWSMHEASPLLGRPRRDKKDNDVENQRSAAVRRSNSDEGRKGNLILYVIYAVVNVIIAVPGLYGTF